MDSLFDHAKVTAKVRLRQTSGTATPGAEVFHDAAATFEKLPKKEQSVRLDCAVHEIFEEKYVIVGENGGFVDQDMNICEYLAQTKGTIYVNQSYLHESPHAHKNVASIPDAYKQLTPHSFSFELQQQVQEKFAISCRLTFTPWSRMLALHFKDAYTVLQFSSGTVYVNISQPRSSNIEIDSGATLTLENTCFSMDSGRIFAPKSSVDSLRQFLRMIETPEDKNAENIRRSAAVMREMSQSKNLSPELVQVTDDEQFMKLLSEQYIRSNGVVREALYKTWSSICRARIGSIQGINYVNRRVIRTVMFLLENQSLSLMIYVLMNIVIGVLVRRINLFIDSTSLAFLCANVLIAVSRNYFHIDVLDIIVQRSFPTVYPAESNPSQMEKCVQQLIELDEDDRVEEIPAIVDQTKIFPSYFRILAITLLSIIPSLVFMWKHMYTKRRAHLIKAVQVELEKEHDRRRALANASAAPVNDEESSNEVTHRETHVQQE